jgi:hypothetical protein
MQTREVQFYGQFMHLLIYQTEKLAMLLNRTSYDERSRMNVII